MPAKITPSNSPFKMEPTAVAILWTLWTFWTLCTLWTLWTL